MACSYSNMTRVLSVIHRHYGTLIVFVPGIEEITYDFDDNRVLWRIDIPEKWRCPELELAIKLR